MFNSLKVIWILTHRELSAKLASVWFFALLSLVCILAMPFGAAFIRSFETESVLVSSGPLAPLNGAILAFLGLVSGLRLAGSLSWEREHRTLEVLLVSPASHASVIASKFLAELIVLAIVVVFYCFFLLIGQPMGKGVISLEDAVEIVGYSVYVLPSMALGLLVSSASSSVRTAVAAFLLIFAFLAAIKLLALWLAPIPPTELSLAVLYLRSGLDFISIGLDKVSSVSQLFTPLLIYLGRTAVGAGTAMMSLGLTVVTLVCAVLASSKKGAS